MSERNLKILFSDISYIISLPLYIMLMILYIMSFQKKYLKYKNKYLDLKKLIGGASPANGAKSDDDTFEYIESTESEILQNYTKIPNKGTQNCGVFINKSKGNKILICDKYILDINKIEFLLETENIYPRLYKIYHATDTNKIFYLWKKMDGDIRDFIFEHIPICLYNR